MGSAWGPPIVTGSASRGSCIARRDFEYSVHPQACYRGRALASNSPITVFITTFLASAVEAIEMVIIVVGVGATRGWRSTWIGTASGFGVLAVIVVALGAALSHIPIDQLRLVVG